MPITAAQRVNTFQKIGFVQSNFFHIAGQLFEPQSFFATQFCRAVCACASADMFVWQIPHAPFYLPTTSNDRREVLSRATILPSREHNKVPFSIT